MDNHFEISLHYQSEEYHFPAELVAYGYSYKISVDVFGKAVSFERDEEQRFRAVIPFDELNERGIVDKALLQAIAEQLAELFND